MAFGGFGPAQGSAGGAESVGSADAIQVADGAGAFVARWPLSATQMEAADGSLAAPSIASTNHKDTGIAWDIGSSGDLDFVVDGALNMRLKNNHTSLLQPTIPLQGTPAAPGLCLGNSFSAGIQSSGTSNFGTATGGIKAGWRITGIGGGQGAVHFQDHQTSPAVCCSLSGGYDSSLFDFDTGPSFHVGGTNNEWSCFTAGEERIKYRAGGAIEQSPGLANSTGYVTDTGATQTTDATSDVTAWSKTLADDTTYFLNVSVVGRDGAGVERCSYWRQAQVHREGGGGATLGTINAGYSSETSAGLNATLTVSSNDVRVSVSGLSSTTINWAAAISYIGAE